MAMPVLDTKLFVPTPRARAIRRVRLTTKLDEGLRAGRKLTLVSAQAGFGKTSLLSEWIASTSLRDPTARIAWLSLDEADNDPARFLTYLVAALDRAQPSLDADGWIAQQPLEDALTAIINELSRGDQAMVLVLDDFQVIASEAILDGIEFLLDHLPPRLHVAIATRSDPLLPVARLRARGELTELRAADLRFTPDEAAAFLNSAMGLSLTRSDVSALETRTEGWIAGLQLAALSLQEGTDPTGFISAFTGSNRFVIDYLIEEVLERAPGDVAEFMRETSILERLSGPLCDAVTGRSTGAEMLQALDRANMFVVPLDNDREWYRYHHLFADVLRMRQLALGPDSAPALHRRASEWFERHDSPEDAVRHAFAAADDQRAARLIEASIPAARKSRRDATLLGWLRKLPEETIARRPVLSVFSAWASLAAGDIPEVEPLLERAEFLVSATTTTGTPPHDSEAGDELTALPVTIALYRAALAVASGDQRGIAEHAQRARDIALPDNHLGRGAAAGLLGLASWARGDLRAGVEAFGESRTSLRSAGNLTDALSTTMVIADMLVPLGRLREAQALYEDALRESLERGNGGQPTADLHAGIAEVLLERNLLDVALAELVASEALGEAAFSHEHHFRWFVSMARVREAEGDLEAAVDLFTDAHARYRRGFFPDSRPIDAMKARVRIAQGRLDEAQSWASESGVTGADELTYLREFEHITLARLLIAQHVAHPESSSIDDAIALLARLLDSAESGRRTGSAIEILILQSLVLDAQGHTSLALVPLERALTEAEPEGYVRIFVGEGAPMLGLLRAAAGAGIRTRYVRLLSRALRDEEGASPALPPIAEGLSDRELEVLRLLATPRTGPEIARELHVSLNTMRTHTKHIFAKLDVTSRQAAVRRSEALGLI